MCWVYRPAPALKAAYRVQALPAHIDKRALRAPQASDQEALVDQRLPGQVTASKVVAGSVHCLRSHTHSVSLQPHVHSVSGGHKITVSEAASQSQRQMWPYHHSVSCSLKITVLAVATQSQCQLQPHNHSVSCSLTTTVSTVASSSQCQL